MHGCAACAPDRKELIVNELERYTAEGPVASGTARRAKRLSARGFNLAVSGLLFVGFCLMGLGTYFTGTMAFAQMMYAGSGGLTFIFGTLAVTVVGIVMMSAAASRESAGLSLVGYLIFAAAFGLMSSTALVAYDLPAIQTAFGATAAITLVFGALGVAFPKLFCRAAGVFSGALLALIVVELVLAFLGVSQTITDYLVVIVFAGFIGYDTYRATQVEPTLPNAVLAASNLFMDIVNVFIRILDIVGRDR